MSLGTIGGMTVPALRRVLIANPGADVYGSDLQMLESIKGLTEEGIHVVVVCPERGRLIPLVEAAGAEVRVIGFPVVRRSYLSPVGLVRLTLDLVRALPVMVRTLREVRPGIVYVNTTTVPWWIVLPRLLRIPAVCHVHEAEDADNPWVLRALNAPLLATSRVIFISQTSADATLSIYPQLRPRSVIVLNGVPDRDEPPVPPPATPGVTHLAVVGRLSPRKGTATAILAAAALRKRGHTVRLEVAGTVFPGYEWYEEELRDLVSQSGLEDVVAFTGYVSPSFVAFDRADIVLAPSVREPFGNAVVEAQLSERPVVAARAGGHRESIVDDETGLLVGVADIEETANAVESLIADPALARRISFAARASARDRFGVGRYRSSIRETLEETVMTLKARGSPSRRGLTPRNVLRRNQA